MWQLTFYTWCCILTFQFSVCCWLASAMWEQRTDRTISEFYNDIWLTWRFSVLVFKAKWFKKTEENTQTLKCFMEHNLLANNSQNMSSVTFSCRKTFLLSFIIWLCILVFLQSPKIWKTLHCWPEYLWNESLCFRATDVPIRGRQSLGHGALFWATDSHLHTATCCWKLSDKYACFSPKNRHHK